ncbi:hypothetical protein C4E04_11415 [Microvirga sp. 17 mud 1-3]|nr:hypothetical protein C4E04_11415 [Microvirga sp. 17 mud 1-3]
MDPATISLSNRKIVTLYDDHSNVDSNNWKVRGNILDATGQDNEEFFLDRGYKQGSSYQGSMHPDVTLVKGGYVASWMRGWSETAHFYAQRFNAAGTKVGELIRIQDTMGGIDLPTSQSVASLSKGGFVSVASSDELALGLIYYFQRFDANGRALDKKAVPITTHDLAAHYTASSYDANPVTVKQSIKAVGLRDGGFAVTYVTPLDLGPTQKDWDIVTRIYNADGTPRTEALHVGTAANSSTGIQAGIQGDPNITTLSNDAIVVSWTNHTGSDTNIQGRVLDSQGKALTDVVDLAASSRGESEASLAGLSAGKFVATWTVERESGGNTTGIQGREFRLSRTTVGDDKGEVLTGDSLVDVIHGNGGDDIINGKSGNDILSGGEGKDVFVFDLKPNRQTNFDKIADFSPVDDSIYLSHKIFTGLGKKGSMSDPVALSKAAFWVGTAAHDANDRIIYNKTNGALYYDPDGKGGADPVKIAALTKGLALTEKDFFII